MGIGEHLFEHGLLARLAHGDAHAVVDVASLGHLPRGVILIGAAGESHDHGEVVLLHTFRGERQPALGAQGHVVGRVGSGLAVGVGIDAEEREVARVAGPDPVVGVGAELSDRRGGSTHEAHVAIDLLGEHIVDVAAIEGLDLHLNAGMLLEVGLARLLACQLVEVFRVEESHTVGVALLGPIGQDVVGHIVDAVDEGHGQPRVGQLLGARHGPEAIRQVVVLERAVALDGGVSAVVVGQHEAVFRDDFARASSAEAHDYVFQ